MMFKWMPDAPVRWRDVWLGAVGTAALFEIGKFLIGLYIGKQGLESTFGAASSLVVVLIWVYYSAQIVLLGAEFTHAQAKRNGHVASTPSEERVGRCSRAIPCPGLLPTRGQAVSVTTVPIDCAASAACRSPRQTRSAMPCAMAGQARSRCRNQMPRRALVVGPGTAGL